MHWRTFAGHACLGLLGFTLVYAYAAIVGDEALASMVGMAGTVLLLLGFVAFFVAVAWRFFDASKELVKLAVERETSRRPPSG